MSELQRYGLEWKSDTDFIATPMSDGYWTPWHIAQERLTTAQAENERLQARVAELSEALQVAVDTPELGGGTWYDMAVAALAERAGGEK